MIVLCKLGYGSLEYIEQLDTPDFLDLVEYEHIEYDILKNLENT